MTKKSIEQNYKHHLENILKPLLKDFPEDMDFFALLQDHVSGARLTQAVQLYLKIAKLNKELEQEKEDITDNPIILREDLIKKVKNLIHP